MKIVVLAGGHSPEHDVSLSSGSLIANALLENGHEVVLLDLYEGLRLTAPLASYFHAPGSGAPFSYRVPEVAAELQPLSADASLIGPGVMELCRFADLVFLSLHGSMGENGQIQAIFDAYGISYTGTGYIGSLLAMDKDLSKQLMASHGVLTPRWSIYDPAVPSDIPFPCVVKPCSCGSSVGVALAEDAPSLALALGKAGDYDDRLLIEERIVGREFSVGILDGRALPPIEIVVTEGFYDYRNQYQPGLTKELCPAPISEALCQKLQTLALTVHSALRLGYYSRIDFIVDAGEQPYCLEANTLPGMTPTSLLPQEAAAAGISYTDLCEKIAQAGVKERRR